jgi:hypothetical protein
MAAGRGELHGPAEPGRRGAFITGVAGGEAGASRELRTRQ